MPNPCAFPLKQGADACSRGCHGRPIGCDWAIGTLRCWTGKILRPEAVRYQKHRDRGPNQDLGRERAKDNPLLGLGRGLERGEGWLRGQGGACQTPLGPLFASADRSGVRDRVPRQPELRHLGHELQRPLPLARLRCGQPCRWCRYRGRSWQGYGHNYCPDRYYKRQEDENRRNQRIGSTSQQLPSDLRRPFVTDFRKERPKDTRDRPQNPLWATAAASVPLAVTNGMRTKSGGRSRRGHILGPRRAQRTVQAERVDLSG